MKTAAFTTGLLALAGAAAAAPAADAKPSKPFYIIAAHSGSPIHLQEVNANGEGLWINKPTASYCPSSIVKDCPPGNTTALIAGNGGLSMDVEVPGGQQAYINPTTRALQYSIAHSAVPQGAITTGFIYTPGSSYGTLGHKGGFVACKVGSAYQVFVPNASFTKKGCIGFDALAPSTGSTAPAAWQYQ